jgi:nitrate/TMAO reductase-like tetraheme cytochrome c subunit
MAPLKVKRRQLMLTFALLLSALMSLAMAKLVTAEEVGQVTEDDCLSCHADPTLSITLPSGENLPLSISAEELSQSIHTQLGIECVACHAGIETYPHPPLEYASRRELSQAFYQTCWKCHSNNYDRTLDSMHADVAAAGNQNAPICTDCHGSHDVRPPDQPRTLISETCGQCHTTIFTEYKSSIHGAALIEEQNLDVPVCIDCHGVHNIQDPRTMQFHVETPELCAGCHADPELMEKYGLSADVYSLYMLSWHGVDVSVYKAKWPTIWHESAVCTDCHGVHDIFQTEDPRSSVNPENLLSTCQQCHPDTGPNWTGAWTGHYPVSFERNPFVFYTDAFYKFFAPAVLWLSGIYVGLQILRATVARVRRSLR